MLRNTATLPRVLHALAAGLKQLPVGAEILIPCDDRFAELHAVAESEGAVFVGVRNPGYGALMLAAVEVSRGEYILSIDPDASYPMDAVRKLWMAREDADVIIASRYVPLSHVEQPLVRTILSRSMNGFFATVLSTPIRDLSSGFRLYRRDVFRRLEFRSRSLAFLLETLLKFAGNGIRVKEIPFHYKLHNYRTAQAHGLRLGLECLMSLRSLWRMRNSVECADYDLRAFNSRIPLQRYWQRRRYRLLMSFAEQGVRTLDVGCGSGRFIADLSGGFGGMVVVGVKGGREAGVKLVDNIALFGHMANVGDAKSLIIHPASTTHSQLGPKEQAAVGISPELLRISVGLEHIDDILGALDDALALI